MNFFTIETDLKRWLQIQSGYIKNKRHDILPAHNPGLFSRFPSVSD
jgi:hypothetical protein